MTVGVTDIVGPNINQAPDAGNRVACDVGLFAVARGSGEATWGDATFRWFGGKDRSVAFDSSVVPAAEVNRAWGGPSIGAGTRLTTTWTLWANIPFSAAVEFHYRVANGPDQVAIGKFDCGPPVPATAPPAEITDIVAVPQTGDVEPGSQLLVEYTAASQVGIWRTAVLVSGPCEIYRQFDEYLQPRLTRSAFIIIPADCELGAAIDVTVYAIDATLERRARQISTPYRLTDKTRPTIRGTTANTPSGPFFTGDTIDFTVTAADNHLVKSVVWEAKPFGARDSVVLAQVGGDVKVRIPVREEWSGPVELRYFVHDAAGLTSDTIVSMPASVAIYPTVERATRVTGAPEFDDGSDAEAVDLARGVVYVLQSARKRIVVLSLASMQVASIIPLGVYAADIDLTHGGDSLIVAIPQVEALGVIDLTRTERHVEMLPLNPDPGEFPPLNPVSVLEISALAGGKLFLTAAVPGEAHRLIEVNLTTGTQRVRTFPGAGSYNGLFADGQLLTRSVDGSAMAIRVNDCVMRYDVPTDAATLCVRKTLNEVSSVDASGQRFAVGPDIYDASWNYLRRIELIPSGTGSPSTLTPDGRDLFLPLGRNIVRASAVDGRILDRQLPPIRPTRMHVSADGKLLIVVGTSVATGLPAIATVDLR